MKCFKAIFFCVIALMAIACRRSDSGVLERLDRAEALVMTDADSAMTSLLEIEPKRVRGREDRARYQLLMAMARYRLNDYSCPAADSLITIAVDYYTDRPDPVSLMKALFLRADLRYRNIEYTEAMDDALHATEIAEKVADYDWKARSAEQIADLFAVTQNFSEALPYIEKAIGYYRAAGKERNVRFALCDKAVALERINHTDESIALLDSLILLSQSNEIDTILMADCLRVQYPILIDNKRWEEGKDRLIMLQRLNLSDEFLSAEYSYLARVYAKDGKISEAKECLQTAKNMILSDYDKHIYFNALVELYKFMDDSESLIQATKDNQKALYHSLREILKQSTLAANGRYYQDKVNLKISEQRRMKRLTVAIVFFLLLTIFIIVYFFHQRILIKNLEIETKIAETISLSKRLAQANQSLSDVTENLSSQLEQTRQSLTDVTDSLSSEIESLFREQWNLLNQIAYQYFESSSDSLKKNLVLDEFKKQLRKLQSKNNMLAIEEMVNKYMSGIMTLLKQECPDLKDEDYKLILLNFAGFEPRTMCLFLDIKLKTFYTKRQRLIQKISERNPTHLELFRSKLM